MSLDALHLSLESNLLCWHVVLGRQEIFEGGCSPPTQCLCNPKSPMDRGVHMQAEKRPRKVIEGKPLELPGIWEYLEEGVVLR